MTKTDSLADALYADTPAPANPKADNVADAMYRPSHLTNALGEIGPRFSDATGATIERRKQFTDKMVNLYHKTGLPEDLLARIGVGSLEAEIAAARPGDDPDAVEMQRHQRIVDGNRESREALRDIYGEKDAEALMTRANRFVKSHPVLNELLKDGLGSRPDIVKDLVAFVFSNGLGRA